MEQKLSQNNITFSIPNVMKVTAVIVLMTLLGLFFLAEPRKIEHTTQNDSIPDIQTSTYGISLLSITSKNTGTGLINLDGYLVPVDFKFETYPSDYGIEETAFTAVDITNLEIGQITDGNGNHIDDFTNFQDHKRINEALKNFIEANKLVEVR